MEFERIYQEETTAIIPCTLGESEIRQRGQELAAALEELEALKEERKAAMDELKKRADNTTQRVAKLREIVKTGVEALEQPCVKVYDCESHDVWFEYNGQQYHRRPMRDDERGRVVNRSLFETEDECEQPL